MMEAKRLGRVDAACVALVVLLALLMRAAPWPLGVSRLTGPIDLRWDAGVYWTLGASLAEGRGYRLLNEPGDIQAVQYPPLLPVVLAGVHKFAGTSDPATVGPLVRHIYTFLWLAYVAGVYLFARRYVSPGFALAAAAMVALQRWSMFLSDLCFAEVPFACTTLLFFALSRRGDRPRHTAATALAGWAAYLLRTAGLALLAAWVAEAALQKRFRLALLRGALAALPVLGWLGYIGWVERGEEYRHPAYAYQRASYQFYNVSYAENLKLVDPFYPESGRLTPAAAAERFLVNWSYVPLTLGETVSETRDYWAWLFESRRTLGRLERHGLTHWYYAPLLLLGGVAIFGGAVLVRRREWLFVLYVLWSLGLICVTPWPQQLARYTAPMAPFVVVATLVGLTAITDRLRNRPGWWPRPAAAAAVAAVLLPTFIIQGHTLRKMLTVNLDLARYTDAAGVERPYPLFFYDRYWEGYDRAIDWLHTHAPRHGVVCTLSPHWTYLHSGLKAVQPPFVADPAEFQRLMDAVPVTYLVSDDFTWMDVGRRYVRPGIEGNPQRWREIYRDEVGRITIYRRAWDDSGHVTTTEPGAAPVLEPVAELPP